MYFLDRLNAFQDLVVVFIKLKRVNGNGQMMNMQKRILKTVLTKYICTALTSGFNYVCNILHRRITFSPLKVMYQHPSMYSNRV